MLSTYLYILMPVSRGHIHVAQQGENIEAIYCMLDYQYSVDVQRMDQGKMKPCNVANTDVAPASKTTIKSMTDILISFLYFLSKLRSSTPANFHIFQYEIETGPYDSICLANQHTAVQSCYLI